MTRVHVCRESSYTCDKIFKLFFVSVLTQYIGIPPKTAIDTYLRRVGECQ